MSIKDKLTYEYLKKIKKWMYCPNCKGIMHITPDGSSWNCEACDYSISSDEFEDDYVFWFCDKCETFLNVQPGFTEDEEIWVCTECGCLNDVSGYNLKGICKYCGALLEDPDKTICPDCEIKKLEELQRRLEQAHDFVDEISNALKE